MSDQEQSLVDEGYEDEGQGKCPRCFADINGETGVCAACHDELLEEAAADEADDFEDDVFMQFTCSACAGTGQDWDLTPCQECDGEGFYYWK